MNRALHYALLLSLALHGVILFGLSTERQGTRRNAPPAPIAARLVEPPPATPPPAPPAPPAPPQPVVPRAEPVKPPPRAVQPKAAPEPKALARPAPPVAPGPDPLPAAPAAEPVAPAAPGMAGIEPALSAPPVAPAAPGAPSAGEIEARSREQYRLQVIDAARSHNRYPPLARENNWEGQVGVRMLIGPDGKLAALTVEKTSGHPVLDRQALEMFRRAQAAVPLPAALRGKGFSLELWAIFNLKDQVSG